MATYNLGNTSHGVGINWRVVFASQTANLARTEAAQATGVADYMRIWARNDNPIGEYMKLVIWNNDGTLVTNGITNPLSMPPYTGWSWKTLYFSTQPTITEGLVYYVGVLGSGNRNDVTVATHGDTGDFGGRIGNNYTTPTNFNPDSRSSKPLEASVYITYTEVGPSLLIEGITPGKIEDVDWVDIADIK